MQTRFLQLILTHGLAAALVLIRNLVAARLLGAEEFGIAALFAITAGLVEALTALGLHQLILRDPKVQSRRAQATLHLMQLLRGGIGAVLILILARPLTQSVGVPQIAPTLAILAFVPLLTGFQHLDAIRAMRHGRYHSFAVVQIGAGFSGLITLLMLAQTLSDHRAMLGALLIHAVAACILSHICARRRYHLSYVQRIWSEALGFGRPILLNGLLLAVILQAEKLVVGNLLGPSMLGIFALGLTLTIAPAMVLARAQQSYFLPRLNRDPGQFPKLIQSAVTLACLIVLIAQLSVPLVPRIFPTSFAPLTAFMPLLGVLAGLRLLRSAAVTFALARGLPKIAIFGNLPRVLVLPVFYLTLARGFTLELSLTTLLIAELFGLMIVMALLRRPKQQRNAPQC